MPLLFAYDKSRFFHDLAQIILALQSGDEEELQTIKDEENKVRGLIQETLVKSDELSVSTSP